MSVSLGMTQQDLRVFWIIYLNKMMEQKDCTEFVEYYNLNAYNTKKQFDSI